MKRSLKFLPALAGLVAVFAFAAGPIEPNGPVTIIRGGGASADTCTGPNCAIGAGGITTDGGVIANHFLFTDGGELVGNTITFSTAPVNLFVDPTGSNTNACTSAGASACLTIQGALNKSPKHLYHQLTVSVAAGSYAGFIISGFIIDPSVQKTTAGILIDGALANVAPATGTATGTASAGSAGSGSTFGTLTDGTQTWTVNDPAIVGKFVVITGGTGSGQVRPIVLNTATTLTIAGTWTAPTGTSTYAIQSPSVIITSATAAVPKPQTGADMAAAGIQIADNVTGASRIAVRNVAISIAATNGVSTLGGNVELIQVLTTGSTSGVSFLFGSLTVGTITTGSTNNTNNSGLSVGAGAVVTANNARFVNTTAAVAAVAVNGFAAVGRLVGCQMTGGLGANALGGGSITALAQGSRCDCLSLANSACIIASGSPPGTIAVGGIALSSSVSLAVGIDVTNCTTGLYTSGTSSIGAASAAVVSGNALTYGGRADYGGLLVLPTATTTITGGTAEMSVDNGASTGTWASLAAAFNCLTALGTGSSICRL